MTEAEITAFLSIIRNGTISGAAEQLYLSQPALSRRISSLEEQLGCRLFERRQGQRYIELTPAGKAFIPLARRWQALLSESAALNAVLAAPSLRLGSIGSLFHMLAPVYQRFLEQYPECRLQVFQHHSTECYEHLENGTLDFALISDDSYAKNTESFPVFKDSFYLLSRTALGTDPIAPTQLDPGREIRIPWTPEFDLWHDYWFDTTAKAHIFLDQMTLLEYFASHTDSWLIAPAHIAKELQRRQQLFCHTLTDPPPEEIIYYLQPKDPHKVNPYGAKLVQLLKEILPALNPELTMLL